MLWTTTNSLPLCVFATPWRSPCLLQLNPDFLGGPNWWSPQGLGLACTGRQEGTAWVSNQRNKRGLFGKVEGNNKEKCQKKHPKHLAEVSWSIVNHISCVYIFQTAKLEYSNDLHPSDNLSQLVIRWDCRHFSCDIAMFTKARGYWGWHLMVHLASKRSNAWGP